MLGCRAANMLYTSPNLPPEPKTPDSLILQSKSITSASAFTRHYNSSPDSSHIKSNISSSFTRTVQTTHTLTYTRPPKMSDSVYINTAHSYSGPLSSHEHNLSNPFNESFDLSSYSRTMHQHTKKQMEAASRSARRRTNTNDTAHSYHTEGSESSANSMDSARS